MTADATGQPCTLRIVVYTVDGTITRHFYEYGTVMPLAAARAWCKLRIADSDCLYRDLAYELLLALEGREYLSPNCDIITRRGGAGDATDRAITLQVLPGHISQHVAGGDD